MVPQNNAVCKSELTEAGPLVLAASAFFIGGFDLAVRDDFEEK